MHECFTPTNRYEQYMYTIDSNLKPVTFKNELFCHACSVKCVLWSARRVLCVAACLPGKSGNNVNTTVCRLWLRMELLVLVRIQRRVNTKHIYIHTYIRRKHLSFSVQLYNAYYIVRRVRACVCVCVSDTAKRCCGAVTKKHITSIHFIQSRMSKSYGWIFGRTTKMCCVLRRSSIPLDTARGVRCRRCRRRRGV